MTTPISHKVHVDAEYLRAINLEHDGQRLIDKYILTDNALRLLRQIGDNLAIKDAPRSWMVTGTYGTGKSAFALYLSALLGAPKSSINTSAQKICKQRDSQLATVFAKQSGKKGFCKVMVTGSREPMASKVMTQLAEAMSIFLGNKKNEIIKTIKSKQRNLAASNVVEVLRSANKIIVENGGSGILIGIDELGKFLEYDAKDARADNTFLLQALAELCRKRKKDDGNIMILGVSHRDLDDYGRKMGKDARAELSKVRGRFESLTFAESQEQMLRLIGKVVSNDFDSKEKAQIRKSIDSASKIIWEKEIVLSQTFLGDTSDIFEKCYPLHPISAVLLTWLSEKMGQNERTLFNYLTSAQAYSFAKELEKIKKIGDCIMPSGLYDYFLSDGLPGVTNSSVRKQWAEIEEAMARLGNVPKIQSQILRTIALFNITGGKGKIVASKEILSCLFPDKEQREKAINFLEKKSLITFRKYSGGYHIWEGSDFDLEGAIEKEMGNIGEFDFAQNLDKSPFLSPVIAHKHAIETGNIRHLDIHFLDANASFPPPNLVSKRSPCLYVFLSQNKHDGKKFKEICNDCAKTHHLLIKADKSDRLEGIVIEYKALERILNSYPELRNDPTARREAKLRLAEVYKMKNTLISALVSPGAGKTIYWKGESFSIENRRALQKIISRVMDETYPNAPHIINELINKEKPSAIANTARNKLLAAMHRNSEKSDFGIEKYPPEKALYRSLFTKGNLHRKIKGKWQLCKPEAENDPQNFSPVWQQIEDFLTQSESGRVFLSQLDDILIAPPYGVKTGVILIFYVTVLLTHKNDIAVYEDGKFTPFFDEPCLERFLAAHNTFSFKYVPMKGVNESLVNDYQAIMNKDGKRRTGSLLVISRPLFKFINDLPNYTKNTNDIPSEARNLCNAIRTSKSPHDMVLHDIPKIFGFDAVRLADGNNRKIFIDNLNEVLHQLRKSYSDMLKNFQTMAAENLDIPKNSPVAKIRKSLAGRAAGLEKYTIDKEGLAAFLQHATHEGGEDNHWFTKMLLFLSGKSPKEWEDADKYLAEFKLAEYLRRMADLETLRAMTTGVKSKDMALVRIISTTGELEELIHLEETPSSSKIAKELKEKLRGLATKNRLALLAHSLRSELASKSGERKEKGKKHVGGK